jgi:glycosyltransferase involved in cell wall biosynthesis
MSFGDIHGGSERLMDDFLRYAEDVDVAPHVVFLEDGPWPEDLRDRGFPVTVIDPGRFRHVHRNVAAFSRLRALMLRERPDVVLSWIARAQVTLAPAAMAAGMRRRLAWYQWLVRGDLIERAATALPAEVVLTCSAEGMRAQQALRPRRRTELAYPGIEPPDLLEERDLAGLRSQLGLTAGPAVVGISGRLVRWKNQDALLRAVALLRQGGRDVQALVVGGEGHGHDAGYRTELEQLAGDLGIADQVTFTGHRTDAVALTQLMDVAVNASDPEPFGLVVLEALACRRPVVAVARGGPAEIIDDGTNGVLVEKPAPDLLAAAIGPLVDDPALRARMGESGREQVLARFTPARFAASIRTALDGVASSS